MASRPTCRGLPLLYSTVYGEPCTIDVRPDGALVGRAGYPDEDCDVGRCGTENDRWFREWTSWAHAVEGQLADTAVIARTTRAAR